MSKRIFNWEDMMEMGQAVMALSELPPPPIYKSKYPTAEEQWEEWKGITE